MPKLTETLSFGALLIALAAAALPVGAQPQSKNACTTRDANAAMTSRIPIDLPPIAALQGLTGSAVVQLELDADGSARNAKIATSSGHAVLDTAAVNAALEQKYAPQIRDCESVPGSYLVDVDFTADAGR